MSTYKIPLYCILAIFWFQPQARAWHQAGHEVVAAIAWDRMTPTARAKAVGLLRTAPINSGLRALRPTTGTEEEKDRTQFIQAAIWADAVREGPRKALFHQPLWHFTDFFWEQSAPGATPVDRNDKPPHGDLVTKLPAIEASLKNMSSASVSPSKATDLAWFIHLMGDISQPLHCSGRITPALPDGDQGGNLFCASSSLDSNGKCAENLHSFWDHVVEKKFGEHPDIPVLAARLENDESPSFFTRLRLGQYEQWAKTSQKIAKAVAYPATLGEKQDPSPAYLDLVERVSVKVITLAGFRLGKTLNAIFPE